LLEGKKANANFRGAFSDLLSFGHRPPEVTAANAEFDRDVALAALTVDEGRAGIQ
jgi:hypothetical protein